MLIQAIRYKMVAINHNCKYINFAATVPYRLPNHNRLNWNNLNGTEQEPVANNCAANSILTISGFFSSPETQTGLKTFRTLKDIKEFFNLIRQRKYALPALTSQILGDDLQGQFIKKAIRNGNLFFEVADDNQQSYPSFFGGQNGQYAPTSFGLALLLASSGHDYNVCVLNEPKNKATILNALKEGKVILFCDNDKKNSTGFGGASVLIRKGKKLWQSDPGKEDWIDYKAQFKNDFQKHFTIDNWMAQKPNSFVFIIKTQPLMPV